MVIRAVHAMHQPWSEVMTMESAAKDFWLFRMDLRVRAASALSGALVGGTAGMVGGVEGMGIAGVAGALLGAWGGRFLERRTRENDRAELIAEIEPACTDCVSSRAQANDASATCAAHPKHHHGHSLLHYEYPQPFGVGSSLLRPNH